MMGHSLKPQWDGDLLEDCSARWEGLLLRAEEMEAGRWWWAVSWEKKGGEIDSSNHHELVVRNGAEAREAAEAAARKLINPKR